MQTFLPFTSFKKSASVLDMRRLGKQRVETLQILNCLIDPQSKRGWRNHPAVKMWEGHEGVLLDYGISICKEWIERGYKDTCLEKMKAVWEKNVSKDQRLLKSQIPNWLGTEILHLSHKSNLLRKDELYYSKWFSNIRNDIPYYWPVA